MIYTCTPGKVSIYLNTERKSAQQVREELGCDAVINGGLYDMTAFKPVCHLKVNGTVYAADQYKYWGYAFNAVGGMTLTTDYAQYANYICCVCMVRDGHAEQMIYDPALGSSRGRTAIGTFPDGRIWMYASSLNITPEQLQALALKDGVKDAVMLDGGGSTQGAFPDGNITTARRVHNYICVWAQNTDSGKDKSKMKIYLSPSSQPANIYAAGNTNEQEQCRLIADAASAALKRCGFDVKVGAAEIDYTGRTKESNAWGADLHIPIHTNAGGGHGVRVFVYGLTSARVKYANPVYSAINAIAPYKSTSGVTANAGLYEVKNSSGKCVYIEAAFHDNTVEAAWIVSHTNDIGEAICKGICEGTGAEYIAPAKDNAVVWAKNSGLISDGDDLNGAITRLDFIRALHSLLC